MLHVFLNLVGNSSKGRLSKGKYYLHLFIVKVSYVCSETKDQTNVRGYRNRKRVIRMRNSGEGLENKEGIGRGGSLD